MTDEEIKSLSLSKLAQTIKDSLDLENCYTAAVVEKERELETQRAALKDAMSIRRRAVSELAWRYDLVHNGNLSTQSLISSSWRLNG